jgi:hypothetical protein
LPNGSRSANFNILALALGTLDVVCLELLGFDAVDIAVGVVEPDLCPVDVVNKCYLVATI